MEQYIGESVSDAGQFSIPEQPCVWSKRGLFAPVNIRGTLRHPSISLSTPALVKQGAAAAILGAVATPFAAVLAFVDPGLAKNADCATLTDEAAGKVAQPPPPDQSK